jgi:hypothetical protein
MTRPSPEALLEEAAQLAYHYHWPLDAILDLEHADRRRFLRAAEDLARPAGREESGAVAGGEEWIEQVWE